MKMWRIIPILAALGLMLCSCAMPRKGRLTLPATTDFFSQDLSDQRIYLTLRMADGKKRLFIADTGAGVTILDKSLEPLLGRRLYTGDLNYKLFGVTTNSGVYAAPNLWLGGVPLENDAVVCTDDLSRFGFGRPVKGILGINCLRNYCLQLDFAARKIRFLNPDPPGNSWAGQRFAISYDDNGGRPWIQADFFGEPEHFTIDSGFGKDFALQPERLDQAMQALKAQALGQNFYAKTDRSYSGAPARKFLFASVDLNHEACTNLLICDSACENLLGFRFLERHLATLDFPRNALYLEPREAAAFVADTRKIDHRFGRASDLAAMNKITEFLQKLKMSGRLPGWSANDHEKVTLYLAPTSAAAGTYPLLRTCEITRENDPLKYYCVIELTSQHGPLKLQRAWQADASGKVVKEWPVPDWTPAKEP